MNDQRTYCLTFFYEPEDTHIAQPYPQELTVIMVSKTLGDARLIGANRDGESAYEMSEP